MTIKERIEESKIASLPLFALLAKKSDVKLDENADLNYIYCNGYCTDMFQPDLFYKYIAMPLNIPPDNEIKNS